jgi:quercetin dioxygenase-like cupin family protein
LLSA